MHTWPISCPFQVRIYDATELVYTRFTRFEISTTSSSNNECGHRQKVQSLLYQVKLCQVMTRKNRIIFLTQPPSILRSLRLLDILAKSPHLKIFRARAVERAERKERNRTAEREKWRRIYHQVILSRFKVGVGSEKTFVNTLDT